jgi:hypothetical protein
MATLNIIEQRLNNQLIINSPAINIESVVSRLGAIQAQDYFGALWAIGLRSANSTFADVERTISERKIIRSWPIRGTLHFVSASDIRWMLAIIAPGKLTHTVYRDKELGLDIDTYKKAVKIIIKALSGGKSMTRQELMEVIDKSGIPTGNQRGYHLLAWAAQTGITCFGPKHDKQHTFVLLDEWLPKSKILNRDEALAELAKRYFTGHGPATLSDYVWWSGLSVSEARFGLNEIKSDLIQEKIAGSIYWILRTNKTKVINNYHVFLLPGFDEYLLGYKERSAIINSTDFIKVNPGLNGMLSPTIIINGRVVGVWKRIIKKNSVIINLQPFRKFTENETEYISSTADRYGKFLGLKPEINLL